MINLVLKKQCIDVNSQYMKIEKVLKQAFGINEYELIDFPKKNSGIQISRLLHGDKMGCSYCFPHGFETVNSRQKNIRETGKNIERLILKVESRCRKTEVLRWGQPIQVQILFWKQMV